ncbi:MAG: endonuclease MutS2 [Eubacterium sp.]|nr:endonuclease MutS2 [Eubacterium sp.]
MNTKVENTLEFNKIIEMLTEKAGSSLGQQLCRDLKPMDDISAIKEAQNYTSDALARIARRGNLGFTGLLDVSESLARLEIGSTLGSGELLQISSILKVASDALKYVKDEDDDVEPDTLTPLFEKIEPLTFVKSSIDKAIIAEDEIADDASTNLKNIRRQMKIAGDRIHTQLNSLVNSKAGQDYLQDSIITMRDGRYCVPVKQEHRAQIPGVVHDQSSTGSTVFVEPSAVVDLNNKLHDLSAKEADEIQVILANLSLECSEHIEEIKRNIAIMSELDFIFAKGMLAKEMKATAPELNEHGQIDIKQGRHPLLDTETVVPIDVRLGKDFTLLVVTGPNTGGKTVSLKTVGLLTLMGQSGLLIPADIGSKLGVFKEMFADIGDEQSIEQSLSTFSSHMVNTVDILSQADENSLVLFDELGAGTDPIEGAALGISILTNLKERGCRIMATTHYSELKLYALETDGVQNASCEFNVDTLKPTYRLLIGLPGKSNAFAISSKLGLDDSIIDDAKSRIDSEDEQFEDVLAQIEKQRIQIEKDQETIKVYKSQISSLKEDYEKRKEKLLNQRERIIGEAKEEASAILKKAKTTADEAIRNINKHGASANVSEMEKSRSMLNAGLKETSTQGIKRDVQTREYKPSDFQIGTGVKVLSMNLEGTVSSLPNEKGDMKVQMGILNSIVNIKDVEILDELDIKAPGMTHTSSGKIQMDKKKDITMEINLIGKNTDDALNELEKYLDDAYIAKLPQVRIIHGKGTGTLRKAVQNYLKKSNLIDSYRDGAQGEGGSGATIAIFK